MQPPLADAEQDERRRRWRRRLYSARAVWVLLLVAAYRVGHRPLRVIVLGRESRAEMIGTRHPAWEIASVIEHQPCRRRINEIVLHHSSDPSAARYHGEPTIEAVLRFHVHKGWHNLAYHYVVAPDGTTWLGRPLTEVGTHTVGHNDRSVGVCLILNGDVEQPSQAQIDACTTVLRTLLRRFHLSAETNFANGRGFHRDYADKTCPGSGITKALVLGWLKTK